MAEQRLPNMQVCKLLALFSDIVPLSCIASSVNELPRTKGAAAFLEVLVYAHVK